ncbi:MAG: site-specific integrase, partial [Nitrospinales bacterium]
MQKWQKTRFPGVRYREGEKRFEGKPDRYFVIRYKRSGSSKEEPVGWTSEGITPQFAANIRSEIIKNVRLGVGPQTIKEKRKLKSDEKQAELDKLEAENRDALPFCALAEKYIEWAKTEKKSWKDDQ